MWKKDDSRAVEISPANISTENSAKVSATTASSNRSDLSPLSNSSRATASISKGIRITGDVTGCEDIFVDGSVEGKLTLENCSLTIGPNGLVRADVTAREVIVHGKVEGKVMGSDRVALLGTGEIAGEVKTDKLSIEEGGILRGKVETGKAAPAVPRELVKEQVEEIAIENVAVSTETVVE
jgi:cytoskeletal protein CcmA (bactofilin family)